MRQNDGKLEGGLTYRLRRHMKIQTTTKTEGLTFILYTICRAWLYFKFHKLETGIICYLRHTTKKTLASNGRWQNGIYSPQVLILIFKENPNTIQRGKTTLKGHRTNKTLHSGYSLTSQETEWLVKTTCASCTCFLWKKSQLCSRTAEHRFCKNSTQF